MVTGTQEKGSHRPPAGFREYPIGDEVEKNQIRIAAVYLPPVEMEGMPGTGSSSLIHLEADIHATEGNRNGFAKDEFVPYLIVDYAIEPARMAAFGQVDRADPGNVHADGRARWAALWGEHRDAQGGPLQIDLRDQAAFLWWAGPARGSCDRGRSVVETV